MSESFEEWAERTQTEPYDPGEVGYGTAWEGAVEEGWYGYTPYEEAVIEEGVAAGLSHRDAVALVDPTRQEIDYLGAPPTIGTAADVVAQGKRFLNEGLEAVGLPSLSGLGLIVGAVVVLAVVVAVKG